MAGLDSTMKSGIKSMIWRVRMDKRIKIGYHEVAQLTYGELREISAMLDFHDDVEWGMRRAWQEHNDRPGR